MNTTILLPSAIILFGRVVGPALQFESEEGARRFCEVLGLEFEKVLLELIVEVFKAIPLEFFVALAVVTFIWSYR